MKNNLKRKIVNILKYIFIVFFIPFILVQFLILSGGKDESDRQVDYIIILGGRVYGEKPSRSLNERIMTAAKYLKEHKDIKVIASGGTGKGEKISEAEAIKRELIKNGIDETRIIKEDKSKIGLLTIKILMKKLKYLLLRMDIIFTDQRKQLNCLDMKLMVFLQRLRLFQYQNRI